MKSLMQFLFIFIFIVTFLGCQKNIYETNNVLGQTLKSELLISNGSQYQVDSIISTDKLPLLNNWYSSVFVDYQTNNKIIKRVCFKILENKSEVIYIIQGNNEPFYIEKRVLK